VSAFTHGELVAEVAQGGRAHAGDAHVLAEFGGGLHVEFVEGDDAVDFYGARHVGDGVDHLLEREVFGDVEDVVETFAGPVGVAALLEGKEDDAAAEPLGLAQKFLAFDVGRNAKKSERLWHWSGLGGFGDRETIAKGSSQRSVASSQRGRNLCAELWGSALRVSDGVAARAEN